jgi:hypothetical protein
MNSIGPKTKTLTRQRAPLSSSMRTTARAFYWTHLWLGVLATLLTLVLSVTGIALNHKRGLGLMPDPSRPGALPLAEALPLATLEQRAREALTPDAAGSTSAGEVPDVPDVPIDRMDVRPGHGLVKVRFDDADVTEVTLALADGRVLHVGPRKDVFMEKLHSGELFGDGWVLLSDGAGLALVALALSGLWLWLFPKFRA